MTAEPICVPFTKSGENAFAVVLELATKLCDKAKAETASYILSHYPRSKTINETHDGGKYSRTISSPKGIQRTITYDYRTKAIETN